MKLIPVGDAFHLADSDSQRGFKPDAAFDRTSAVAPALPDQTHSLHVGWRWSKDKAGKESLAMDGHHSNAAGEYLGACVWFEILFKESATLWCRTRNRPRSSAHANQSNQLNEYIPFLRAFRDDSGRNDHWLRLSPPSDHQGCSTQQGAVRVCQGHAHFLRRVAGEAFAEQWQTEWSGTRTNGVPARDPPFVERGVQ